MRLLNSKMHGGDMVLDVVMMHNNYFSKVALQMSQSGLNLHYNKNHLRIIFEVVYAIDLESAQYMGKFLRCLVLYICSYLVIPVHPCI